MSRVDSSASRRRALPSTARFSGSRAFGAILVVFSAGCAVGPDYVAPQPEMPDAWHQELTRGLEEGEANLETWWTVLNDPVLDSLIARAAQGNLELQEAYERIVESQALLGIATGEFFPDIDGIGTYQRSRVSEEITEDLPPGTDRTADFFQGGFDASWEIDLFGRIRRSVESADASLEATIEAYRDVLVLLYAEVAVTYVEIRTLQERIRLAAANVDAQRQTLELTRERLEAEIISELDVRQAELNLASTESAIPALRNLLTQALNRLGVLLGEPPSALHDELAEVAPIPQVPDSILVGLPADLLRQRPDVRSAERQLAAQTAQIGVATADLYPRFSLLGTFALEAMDFGNMWDQGARAYSFGPAFRWNLFDGGRIRNNIKAEESRTRQALIRYERTVLQALEEVENFMVGFAQERDRREALARAVAAAQASVELVQTQYTTGLTDFQNVLDMERSLFLQQDALAANDGLVVQNLIGIYKSLGGGWTPQSGEPDVERRGSGEPDEAPDSAGTASQSS